MNPALSIMKKARRSGGVFLCRGSGNPGQSTVPPSRGVRCKAGPYRATVNRRVRGPVTITGTLGKWFRRFPHRPISLRSFLLRPYYSGALFFWRGFPMSSDLSNPCAPCARQTYRIKRQALPAFPQFRGPVSRGDNSNGYQVTTDWVQGKGSTGPRRHLLLRILPATRADPCRAISCP